MNIIDQIDREILLFFNKTIATSWLDFIIPIITDLHKISFFKWFILVIYIYLFFKNRSAFWFGIFILFSLGINDFIGGQLKNIFSRLRPDMAGVLVELKCPHFGGGSFPSNHSQNLFFLWMLLSENGKLWNYLFLFLACLIAFSRVYCGVHYPSDVIGGALIGIFLGYIFRYFGKYLKVKFLKTINR